MDPNELALYLGRILWTLCVTDPVFFRTNATAAGLRHEEAVGLFVGDCLVHYTKTNHGFATGQEPDWKYVKLIAYGAIANCYGENRVNVQGFANQRRITLEELIAGMLPNVVQKYLSTFEQPPIPQEIPPGHSDPAIILADNVADAEQLLLYVLQSIPNFTNVQILEPGTAFHYTANPEKLTPASFRGAPVTPDLDHTQVVIPSPPAVHDPGVVFAYADLQDAITEGGNSPVVRIDFLAAVQAIHAQEAALDDAPPTLLIVNRQIVGVTIIS